MLSALLGYEFEFRGEEILLALVSGCVDQLCFKTLTALKELELINPDRYWQIDQELERYILAFRNERNRKN